MARRDRSRHHFDRSADGARRRRRRHGSRPVAGRAWRDGPYLVHDPPSSLLRPDSEAAARPFAPGDAVLGFLRPFNPHHAFDDPRRLGLYGNG